jgi:hypothetical protein
MSTPMNTPPTDASSEPHVQTRDEDRHADLVRSRALRKQVATSFFSGQFWFIVKNVLGWTLMLIAWPLGVAIPGPGGIPVFLVGFALASIPGKRRITSHVMRGRPVRVHAGPYIAICTVLSLVAVFGLLWFFRAKKEWLLQSLDLTGTPTGRIVVLIVLTSLLAVIVVWVAVRIGLFAVNTMLRGLPKARRTLRPWLRKYGIHLLPRRREVVDGARESVNENEILALSPEGRARVSRTGKFLGTWAIRIAVLAFVVWAIDRLVFPNTGNPARIVVEATTHPH